MDVRERILVKAHELFNRFGLKRVTMDEIAVKTGMSKKTIYQSFATKDKIVDAVIEDLITKSATACEINTSLAQNAVHEIFLNIQMIHDFMSDINANVLEDMEKFFPQVYDKFYRHKNTYIYQKVKQNLEWGIREGLYRKDIDVNVITLFRMEAMFFPFRSNVYPHAKYSIVDVEIEILIHFLYGICSPEGQKLIERYKEERIAENK